MALRVCPEQVNDEKQKEVNAESKNQERAQNDVRSAVSPAQLYTLGHTLARVRQFVRSLYSLTELRTVPLAQENTLNGAKGKCEAPQPVGCDTLPRLQADLRAVIHRTHPCSRG
jgi:hypothetical protein